MRSLTARYPRLLAAFAVLGLLAACDKDKDVEPPAELVNFKESIKVQRVWNVSLGGAEDVMRVGLAPAADAERVYAAGFDGEVIAVQAATGKTVWRIKTRTQLTGGPGVGAGLVVVGGVNGEVIALEQASGARRWSVQVGGEVLSAPAVAADAVIVRTVAGQLVGLATDDGRQIWREDQQIPRLTLRGVASPVIAGNAAQVRSQFQAVRGLSAGASVPVVIVAQPADKGSLDALAAESVVFERGYAISSYTGRAIGPMMTGRYPTECARDGEHFTRYTPPNVFLAERLKDSGFRTFGAASHFYFERRFGLAQGVDAWDLTAKPEGDGQETTSADAAVADRAIAQLQQPENAAGRFFQWVHFFDPHKQYVEHRDLPLFARGERGRYDREVMNTDRQIGRVLDALRALPGDVARRTVVVVTADHGEAFNEHGMSYHGVEVWDELVRVPWVMHVPGVAARRVTTPRGQIDLAPTLLELLRVAPPAAGAPDAFSGQSLMGDLTAEQPERPIYVELPEGPYNSLRRALVFEGYKLLERGSGRFMLFNLATDAGERNDLAAVDHERLARMRAVMEEVRGGLHVVAAPPPRDRE